MIAFIEDVVIANKGWDIQDLDKLVTIITDAKHYANISHQQTAKCPGSLASHYKACRQLKNALISNWLIQKKQLQFLERQDF